MALGLVSLLGFIVSVRSIQDDNYSLNLGQSINGALLNLGTSSVCGFVAIDHIDRTRGGDLYYGQFQVLHLMGAVPFSRKLSGVRDSAENSSSMLMTKLIQGKLGRGVAGTGTSVFADFYLDFGFYGTALIFLIVGVLNKQLQNKARGSTSILWQVAFICNLTFLTLCSRYTMFGGLIRFVLHATIYVWIIAYALGVPTKYKKRKLPSMMFPQFNLQSPQS
jgi:oligosaccharide repeat unit polymerase